MMVMTVKTIIMTDKKEQERMRKVENKFYSRMVTGTPLSSVG